MAVVAGVYIQRWWVGVIAFAWLCGINWIITLVRHGGLASEISACIDHAIFGKDEVKRK
jgi:hypothetical protein